MTRPLPALKYFDGLFGSRTPEARLELREWWLEESAKGDWDFQAELRAYCLNDVEVLYHLVTSADQTFREMHPDYGASLFHSMTMPSYIAGVLQVRATERWLDAVGLDRDSPQKDERFVGLVQEAAADQWAVLQPYEHGLARAALRGGRTEVKKLLYLGNAKYVDVKSMYPYHQVVQRFPTGLPKIMIWDGDYRPCRHPDCDNGFQLKCLHQGNYRFKNKINWDWVRFQPTEQEVIDGEEWHGFGIVSLTPPSNLVHPVLPSYDDQLGKCVFSLEKMVEQPVVGVELKRALQLGYKLDRMHRWDSYKMEDSRWAEDCVPMYLQKEFNSRNEPEDLGALADEYERVHEDLADEIRKSHGKWGKNPARKKAAKVGLNCIWGKQAERVEKEVTQIFSYDDDTDDIDVFHQNLGDGNYSFKGIMTLGSDRVGLGLIQVAVKYVKNGRNLKPELHKQYMPVASYVTAYARLHLFEEMHKLGERVLMCDTDSIVYACGGYDVPLGPVLGDWEREDLDVKHGGLVGFVSLGPKTYAVKCGDGLEPPPKLKGIMYDDRCARLVNFETMRMLVEKFHEKVAEGAGNLGGILVPQAGFKNTPGKGMYTWMNQKVLRITPDGMKGVYDPVKRYIFPFGYDQ